MSDRPSSTLPSFIEGLIEALSVISSTEEAEVTVYARVNDDVPPGFIYVGSDSEYTKYEMIVKAESGEKKSSITLYIHD